VKQTDNHFCMKQFKPAIILIALLTAGVLGWTAYRAGSYPGKGVMGMMGHGHAMQVATAPPIRAGAKAPHADWGSCTSCHDIIGAGGKKVAATMQVATAPPIRAGAKAPHPDFGSCLKCHDMIPPPPAVPVGQTAPHPDWGACGDCHKMIKGVGKKVAAVMQVATVAPPLGGVWLRPITVATADRLGLDNAHGVLVSGVLSSSSAYAAGPRVGDVIRRIDNKKVEGLHEAVALIALKGPNDLIKLQVLRAGRKRKIFVKIPESPVFQPPASTILAAATGPPSSRIAVASTGKSLDSQVAPVFSSAGAYVLYDPDTGQFSFLDNPGAGSLTAGSQATSQLISRSVGAVIVGNIGPSSSSRLRKAGVQVYSGAFGSVENVIDQYLQGSLVAAGGSVIPQDPPKATADRIAVAASGPNVGVQVAPDLGMAPYLIFYDLGTGETEVVAKDPAPDQGTSAVQTAHLIVGHNASAVVAGNISPGSVKEMSKLGVFSFAGVQGSVGEAIEMYRKGELRATTVTEPAGGTVAAAPGVTL